jgi:hypothetical protein
MFQCRQLNLTDCSIMGHALFLQRNIRQRQILARRRCGVKSATSDQTGREQAFQPCRARVRAPLLSTRPLRTSPRPPRPRRSTCASHDIRRLSFFVVSFASLIHRIHSFHKFPFPSHRAICLVLSAPQLLPPVNSRPSIHPILKPNTTTPHTRETIPVANPLHTRHTSSGA